MGIFKHDATYQRVYSLVIPKWVVICRPTSGVVFSHVVDIGPIFRTNRINPKHSWGTHWTNGVLRE
ncbi:hypothetical protein HanIR_Chr02g0098811 [Helianthus annuus]|nr:hypothetical protein HanIR_Chr02g0098811 [Helianthus annuus]